MPDRRMKPRIIMTRRGLAALFTVLPADTDMPPTDARLALIHDWVSTGLALSARAIEPASSDASFRRYFRVFTTDGRTFIVMDAPPGKEDVRPYVKVTGLLEATGVHVPHIHERDVERGLLLLEDLGSTQYLSRLNAGDDPDAMYGDALKALAHIQVNGRDGAAELAPYDRAALMREMALLPEWFIAKHLALELSAEEKASIEAAFEFLVKESASRSRCTSRPSFSTRFQGIFTGVSRFGPHKCSSLRTGPTSHFPTRAASTVPPASMRTSLGWPFSGNSNTRPSTRPISHSLRSSICLSRTSRTTLRVATVSSRSIGGESIRRRGQMRAASRLQQPCC